MQVDTYKYLESCITSDRRTTSDVKSRIAQAKRPFFEEKISCGIQKYVPGNQEEIYEKFHLERMHTWLRRMDCEEIGEELP